MGPPWFWFRNPGGTLARRILKRLGNDATDRPARPPPHQEQSFELPLVPGYDPVQLKRSGGRSCDFLSAN